METLNKKTLSFPAKIFTQGIAALGMVLVLAACGKGNSGPAVVNQVYGNSCQNCAGSIPSPALLTTFNATSADGVISLVNMQVFAQSSGITAVASGNNYKGYSGPIAVSGQLVVKAPMYDYVPYTTQVASACVIPAGTYALQSAVVGQMGLYGVDVNLPSLITSAGGIELKVEAPSPMGFLNAGQSLWATVKVVRANGVVCSANFYGDVQ